MPERKTHAPGSFCWPEIAAADAAKAKAFYGPLFGWDFREMPGSGYSVAHRGERAVAGMYGLFPEQVAMGIPPHWMGYVRVESADASAAKAAGLGGKVLAQPFDVPGVGRMAVLEDPTGACFAVWESRGFEGAELVDEPGAPCWYELATTDAARAKAFYTALLGWTWTESPLPTPTGPYREWHNGKEMGGGMEQLAPGPAGIPSHWRIYVAVEDCDAVARACSALGGKVHVPPTDIPEVGRFAVLNAPDGAYFSVIRLGGL